MTTVRVMPSRRNQIEMTPDEVAAYLDGAKVLNIATNGPSGFPHLVAMWFVMLDGKPTFWTFGKSQKVMNLRRDPKMSALVESGESYDQLRGVELVGTAQLIEDDDAILEIGKLVAVKYNGRAAAEGAALDFVAKQAQKRIGIAIDVEDTVSWDHTKISGY